MPLTTKVIGQAKASPTKEFFVKMLTRDIELQDAILDLLDNCVDGIIRSGGAKNTLKPYSGFCATIEISSDYFTIEDNCGGIPLAIAKSQAFAMGRPPAVRADRSATVGMYGIGMKRAIFKIGREALVESFHDTGFMVEFTDKWMRDEHWNDLPMHELPSGHLKKKGTRIEIYELNDEAAPSFADQAWIDEFRRTIARHYAFIIAKGFSVTVGSKREIASGIEPIKPIDFRLLKADPVGAEKRRIAPFIFTGSIGEVKVEIYVGLYRKLLTEDQTVDEEGTRGATDDAGWTVACNDRVVIWKDKTRLTGWGEATVPNYHGQFIAITGLVLLSSSNLKALPLTTTKRGIDAASPVYSQVKDLMREATKNLTSFTNKWKKFPEKLDEMYKTSEYVDLPKLRKMAKEVKLSPSRRSPGIQKYEPEYPEPDQERTSARISYVALKSDIALLARHLFEDSKVKPSVVGEQTFKDALKAAKGKRK